MTNLTTQWIVDNLNWLDILKSKKSLELLNKKRELESLSIYKEIKELETEIKSIEKDETELKEKWKKILMDSWIKKFEALDWTTIQLNKKPGKLIIQNEDLIPSDYIKTKTTTSIDKKNLKEDIKQGVIVEWVSIETDYTLVIKSK
jgi:hypothetical protein